MTTAPLIPPSTTTTLPTTTSSSSTPATGGLNLKPEDFINMMVTQLQNQDPLQPASNEQLLSQMSQIGQLESSTQLTTSLQSMVLQNQIGAASGLIGKSVQGLDANNAPIAGMVNSVRVQNDGVALELDSGQELQLARVTNISPPPTATTTAG